MLRVRRASLSDMDDIERVEESSFDANRFDTNVMWVLLTEKGFRTWVAEEDRSIKGYASVFVNKEGGIRLLSIAVVPGCRNRGIGRALLRRMIDLARAKHTRISLEVRVTNVPAINLYLSEGFTIKGMLKDYYSKGRDGPEDALYMTLNQREGEPGP